MTITRTLSRRTLIKLAVFNALGTALPLLRSGQAIAAISDDASDALAKMVKGLYPHEEFPDSVYERVTNTIAEGLETAPESAAMVEQGLATLKKAIPDGNLDQIGQDRIEEILGTLQAEPFFGLVKNQVIHLLYGDPEVWGLIGYGGSSIEYGGYMNRGFNDIDWLEGEG